MCIERVHLKPVDLREVWPHEADDFTPWLAEPEHLSWLGETLNMELADAECEKPVGQFRADILCRNTADSSLVVIEHHLDESDHRHLGQLLTYGTGLEARTLVWVAASFTNEHRETISQLNGITPKDFQIFGVEVKAWEGADLTTYGVTFNVVVEPERGTRSPRNNDDDGSSAEFFSTFREYLETNSSSLRPIEWNADFPDYLGFDIGRGTAIWLAAWLDPNGNKIAANLHMRVPNAGSRFDELKNNRQEIESQFGAKLQWKKSPFWSEEVPQVGIYKNNTDPTDRSDWSNQFEWLREKLEKLDGIFRARVAEF